MMGNTLGFFFYYFKVNKLFLLINTSDGGKHKSRAFAYTGSQIFIKKKITKKNNFVIFNKNSSIHTCIHTYNNCHFLSGCYLFSFRLKIEHITDLKSLFHPCRFSCLWSNLIQSLCTHVTLQSCCWPTYIVTKLT